MADEIVINSDLEIEISAIVNILANDPNFLAKVRANQLMRARTQTNIYGRFAQQAEPQQQTRKLY